jgi:magnesium chelatase accessory protein
MDADGVARYIANMGSRIEPRGVELYARLFACPAHCAGALGMMANWRLEPLVRDLPSVKAPTLLLVGANDGAVPPADADKLKALLPSAVVETLPRLGHLAHEEAPELLAGRIFDHATRAGLL